MKQVTHQVKRTLPKVRLKHRKRKKKVTQPLTKEQTEQRIQSLTRTLAEVDRELAGVKSLPKQPSVKERIYYMATVLPLLVRHDELTSERKHLQKYLRALQ